MTKSGVTVFRFGKYADLLLSIVIAIILIYIVFYYQGASTSAGSSIMNLISSKGFKYFVVAVTFVGVLYIAIVYAKIEDPLTLFAIAGGATVVMAIALLGGEITKVFSTPIVTPKEEILRAVWNKYADPTKNEVYFPGNKTLQMYAKSAGYDVSAGFPFQELDYICIVHTDQLINIQTYMDNPKDLWNKIFYNRIYPLSVYVNGQLYVAYFKCDLREVNMTLISTVTAPSGKTYDLNKEYRHMPREDGLFILNNPPWLTF